MTITHTSVNNAALIALRGSLTGGDEAMEFGAKVRELAAGGTQRVVVDLSEVTFVNSSGLGMLVAGATTMKTHSGELRIASANANTKALFTMTKLDTIIALFATKEEALK